MIALIALAALALVLGAVVGTIALIAAIMKAMFRAARRSGSLATTSTNEGDSTSIKEYVGEFERIVAREWPGR